MDTTDTKLEPRVIDSITRLIKIAKSDTGQSRVVASFLLAWWNAKEQGGFDFTDLWALDDAITADCARVFAFIATHKVYPDGLGPDGFDLSADFATIIAMWRKPKRQKQRA